MIVPDYWAEARKQHRAAGRQVTVRRFGWSEHSPDEAQAMAERRAAEALDRVLGGENLLRREPRIAYNGAEGVPIREEVLARHGEEVITRNAYGAQCLNTPRALFADIDYVAPYPSWTPMRTLVIAVLAVAAVGAGWALHSLGLAVVLLILAPMLAIPLADRLGALLTRWRGGHERVVRQRIAAFLQRHPEWNLRLYRTPAGLRLLATHRGFDATAPEVAAFFSAVGVDPVYARMCRHQHCFRARLTAKPWRIGIDAHLRPRPGVWPVQPERLALRRRWVENYERRARGYAACRYVESLGSGVELAGLRAVIALHDRASRACDPGLPLA